MSVNPSTRLGIPVNLPTGAKYDLLLIAFKSGFPEGQITFDLADTPRKITGIQKVAQTFLKILFTTVGSNIVYPTQGTKFPLLTINANVTTNDAIFTASLVTELNSAESQTKYALNTSTSDPASQLQTVKILGLDVAPERVTMYLQLITAAGATAQVAVPFPQLDMVLNGG